MAHPTDESGTPLGSTPQFGLPAQPQQAFPTSPPPPAAPVRRSKSGLVFGILAVVFFLAAGAMSALYVINKGASDKTIADQKAQIASLQSEVTAKEGEATTAKLNLEKVNRDLTAAQGEAQASAACSQAVKAFFDAIQKNDDSASEAAVISMADKCEVSLL